MKLVVAIVPDAQAGPVIDALVSQELRSTRINTSGGFLKRGNATILVGVEDERADDVLDILRSHAPEAAAPPDPTQSVGAVFVLNVARFVRM